MTQLIKRMQAVQYAKNNLPNLNTGATFSGMASNLANNITGGSHTYEGHKENILGGGDGDGANTEKEIEVTDETLTKSLTELSTETLDKIGEALKLNYGEQGKDLWFPQNLRDEKMVNGVAHPKEMMRISLVSRDHEQKKNIWLLCPPGVSIPDGVEYNQVSLGTIGGRALQASKDIISAGKGDKKWSDVANVADLVAASTVTAIKKSGSALGEKGMLTAGLTANPYVNNAFTGTNIRTFEFAFKMVAENKWESDTIRNIENTFRKFLYPRKHPKSDMVLVYPPYWEITFWRGSNKAGQEELEKNPFMPKIKLCNLSGLNTTFNSSGNYFHTKGQPIEVDITLSFTESMALTREDLYNVNKSAPNYDDVKYRDDVERSGVFRAVAKKKEESTDGNGTAASGTSS